MGQGIPLKSKLEIMSYLFYCTHIQLCVPQYKVNVWSTWYLQLWPSTKKVCSSYVMHCLPALQDSKCYLHLWFLLLCLRCHHFYAVTVKVRRKKRRFFISFQCVSSNKNHKELHSCAQWGKSTSQIKNQLLNFWDFRKYFSILNQWNILWFCYALVAQLGESANDWFRVL